ncbi:hypothetical protein DTO166G4_2823 [Paecilomyces variotii]|nr:hypothetical protein DTO164E3_865 [Paecilomyces variotii]KAJ9215453.1 hypothetical protein DTO166G4_2823 [Paecilomyces variotii]KAJ9298767.1 hypothetical protein DTO217A2_8354 [Paecilomyces variotii]KAJ9351508.1 hypothetical protein DTO027B9_6309 [Paecilomyces variotii]KAJ9388310.1 hypothetical protein DTO063F5_2641 [Paecilomyces variotii]
MIIVRKLQSPYPVACQKVPITVLTSILVIPFQFPPRILHLASCTRSSATTVYSPIHVARIPVVDPDEVVASFSNRSVGVTSVEPALESKRDGSR